jgi:hypothetical protein
MIRSLLARRPLRIAGFAVAAVAVAASAVVVTASAAGYSFGFRSSQPSNGAANTTLAANTTRSKVCGEFMTHFAGGLGVSQDTLNAAFQRALSETLADEVSNKDLTQAQADAIKQKLAGKAPCTLAGGLGNGLAKGIGAQYTQALMSAAASALGITTDQLKADLKSGMTLSQIAAAQKPPVSQDEFRARLIANLKPLLDQAVTDKKLTSDQEQTILQRLQTGPIPFWDRPSRPAATGAAP